MERGEALTSIGKDIASNGGAPLSSSDSEIPLSKKDQFDDVASRQISRVSGLSESAVVALDTCPTESPPASASKRMEDFNIQQRCATDREVCESRSESRKRHQSDDEIPQPVMVGSPATSDANIPVVALATFPSVVSTDLTPDPVAEAPKEMQQSKQDSNTPDENHRSEDSLWNAQVIRDTMVEPPSLPLRIIEALSTKKRISQRLEEREIAQALDTEEDNDVVMFQRSSSTPNWADDEKLAPVVDFDVIQNEHIIASRKNEGPLIPSHEAVKESDTTEEGPKALSKQRGTVIEANNADIAPNEDESSPNSVGKLKFLLFGKRKGGRGRVSETTTAGDDETITSPCSASGVNFSFGQSRDGYEEFLQEDPNAVSPRSRVPGHGPAFPAHADNSLDF